jgi:hypothetical protein
MGGEISQDERPTHKKKTKVDLVIATDRTCSICLEDPKKKVKYLECGHRYCMKCIFEWYRKSKTCPDCRAEICDEELEQRLNDYIEIDEGIFWCICK